MRVMHTLSRPSSEAAYFFPALHWHAPAYPLSPCWLLCAVLSPGALSSALNWYRANTHPRHFGATSPLPPTRLVSVPTLGVWSSADTALLEAQMTASSRYVEAGCWQYVRLEGVGHWMARDAPTQLNRVLLEWLGKQGGRAGGTAGPEGNVQQRQQQPKAPRSRL